MKNIMSGALPGRLLTAGLFGAGIILVASGLLSENSFAQLAGRTVPILLFVAAMTVVTDLAESAGVFKVVTAKLARGRQRVPQSGPQGEEAAAPSQRILLLWLLVVALATVSTIFLSLDTTAVLVTPVVVSLAKHARIHPLPFALTTVWLANTASLLLPVSNLTNLLAQHRLDISPAKFAELMWAPALVGVAVPVAFLFLIFRKQFRGRFVPPAVPAVTDKALLLLSGITLAALLPALVSGMPVWIPASLAAAFLLVVFLVRQRTALRWSMLPVQPLLLAMGLFLVVATLQDHGLAEAFSRFAGTGDGLASLLQIAGVGAVAANGVNNLPGYLALEPLANSPLRLAALLIGVNFGPLVSPWASLATLLWHSRLKALGITISWRGYALAGLCLVVVLIPCSIVALWWAAGMPA